MDGTGDRERPKDKPKAASSLKISTQIMGSPGRSSRIPQPVPCCSQSVADICFPDQDVVQEYLFSPRRSLSPNKYGRIDR
jgi:hypothetical protein